MRAQDLDYGELLELNGDAGVIRFSGHRALLVDAVAMGVHRKYLVDSFGVTAARAVLTQFGFAHGWRMAEAMQQLFTWDSQEEWQHAGARVLALQGLLVVEHGSTGGALAHTGSVLSGSYEAEQHLLHFGRADEPVCWTICGLASGYLSRTSDRETYVLEHRCVGKGDAACHLFGHSREEWGADRADELRFFEPTLLKACLDVSLHGVMDNLKRAERKLKAHRRALTRVAPEAVEALGLVARSGAMRAVVDLAKRVARVDSTVLITGESGAGKERIAKLLHAESTRAAGPFVAINCGAITETLLESELFGHARGAFSGATHDRPGLFEAANGGTLLLDEVGEVSPGMQVKLLRALQEREIRRVGENRARKVDVRVVAATNRNLAHGVAGGSFRQDLYYRLKVVELQVPALRARRDDILPLARVLLAEAAAQMKRKVTGLAPDVADRLVRYDWPGNVREMANAMERGVALCLGERLELVDLPEEVRHASAHVVVAAGAAIQPLVEVEKAYILAALQSNLGNRARTAEQLHIGSATLYRKLKAYGLADAQQPSPPAHA